MKRTIDLAAAVAAGEKYTAAELTVAELVSGYNVAANSDFDWRLRKWVEAFGHLSAWELSSETIEIAAAAMLKAGYKPSTVNRDVSCLGTCYRWAKRERLTPRGFRSPTLGVRRYNEGIRRVEVSPEEIAALRARSLTSSDRRFGVFVHLLIDTGARRSELLERRWNEVDLKAGTIHCPTTKTGVPRILHFRPETAQLMERVFYRRDPDALVFEGRIPGEPISFKRSWEKLRAAVGRPDLHLHDIRHVAAANLLRAGVTIGVAAQVLGHDPQVLARRYGHLETAALRAAQEKAWKVAA